MYPLEGGYHDAITFNDNAVSESAETLTWAPEGKGDLLCSGQFSQEGWGGGGEGVCSAFCVADCDQWKENCLGAAGGRVDPEAGVGEEL